MCIFYVQNISILQCQHSKMDLWEVADFVLTFKYQLTQELEHGCFHLNVSSLIVFSILIFLQKNTQARKGSVSRQMAVKHLRCQPSMGQ